jgi:undecaprenyl-diphosphatase
MTTPAGLDGATGAAPRTGRRRQMFRPLLAALIVALLLLGFASLGSEVAEGETHAFDMAILRTAQALRVGQPWVTEVMRDLSGVGSEVVLSLLTIITVLYLLLVSRRRLALLVALSVVSGTLLMSLLKAAFGRSRPDKALSELVVSSLSFPSGHASMSAIVFLTAGALLACTRSRWAERTFILGACALMTLLIGLSRIALGVHWATDVFGGWAFGCAWALMWLLLAARWAPPQAPARW